MPRLHRNNAAESVMVIALTPIAWISRLKKKRRAAIDRDKAKTAARKAVMIEGLPPRTMN